ncbi:SMP-30/gluconolactonase/LRE family protein [Solimicrobium silvestre]|uniref:Gluconolactonase n=1 Tax=Solimicrobium silvestre TaxID=2099400 RepID=A0A2S9H096_9BURK|nr:SMP-30/gluconolactonase/LRE family protein [Solimicrobium silvestre]PRC93405.1 Gluconolactonase [Solimicrobium silvestre]
MFAQSSLTPELTMSVVHAQKNILGEGLLWHPADQRWWWTDIESATIHAWSGETGLRCDFQPGGRVGSMAHSRSGRILLGMAKWVCTAELPDLAAVPLVAVDPAEPRTRINDGRTDRSGNFVFGTMNEATDKRAIASFYHYSHLHGLRRLALPAVAVANSICFSPDGKTMYFCDTPTRCIMQCDYDSDSAQVNNIRLFSKVADADGVAAFPDGSVIDRHGCLWNAQWGASQIAQYAPDGRLIRRIAVPVKNPTCPAFGGSNLDMLMVTSSTQEMSNAELIHMPDAGSLFGITLPEPIGIAETLFDDMPDVSVAVEIRMNTKQS